MRLSVTPRFLSSKKYIFYTSTNPQRHSSEDSEDDMSRKWLAERQRPTTGENSFFLLLQSLPTIIHMSNALAIKLRNIRQMAPLRKSKLFHQSNTCLRPCWCYSPTSTQLQIQIRQLPSIIHMSDTLAIKLCNIRQMTPLRKSKLFHQSNTCAIIF